MTEKKVVVKKRISKTAIVIVSVVVAVALICSTLLWYFLPKYYASDDIFHTKQFYNEHNILLDSRIWRVHNGLSYEQVVRRIGRPNRQVGTGFFILEYDCLSGRKFHVYITREPSTNVPGVIGTWKVLSTHYANGE